MSLNLYFHPLSSFCWKALIALYENETPFTPHPVNLGDPDQRAALLRLWPIGKFPVLRDDASDRTIPESSIIIEYLDEYYPGRTRFIPADPKLALQTRLRDRFYDLYLHQSVQKIVDDRLRPQNSKDPHGVAQAKSRLRSCYGMVDREMADKSWAMGETYSLADCAASPALYYANQLVPFGEDNRNAAGYLDRLKARASFARVIREAELYFDMFPREA